MRPFFNASIKFRAASSGRPHLDAEDTSMTRAIAPGPGTDLAKDGSRRGGARPGAGRKPKPTTRIVNDVNRIARDKIGEWLPGLLDQLYALAVGVRMRDVRPDGSEVEYYETARDRQACEYLVNRVLGKPTERQETSGVGGSPIPVAILA